MTVGADLVGQLRAAGCVFAEDEARLLRAAAATAPELAALLGRRVAGEPLEQVLGWAQFAGLRIAVEPGVFVPRRRSEHLVAQALLSVPPSARRPVVVDLCCGSGALGAALSAALPGADVHAADLDPVAVRCARRNLPHAAVHRGDLYGALPPELRGRVDLLAVNAPYVPTQEVARLPPEARLHEPRAALDGGADGLDVHRRVAAQARDWLAPGGALLLETSEGQASRTARLLSGPGLAVRLSRDEERGATVVVGTRTP